MGPRREIAQLCIAFALKNIWDTHEAFQPHYLTSLPWRTWERTVSEVKVMHMPPNPFSARAKKIRMERSEDGNDKGSSMVRLVLTVMWYRDDVHTYCLDCWLHMRLGCRRKQRRHYGGTIYVILTSRVLLLSVLSNQSTLTCRADAVCVGHIYPWWCREAAWWRWGGRSRWWMPGSASHLALCKWASLSSEETLPHLSGLLYCFHCQMHSALYRYLEVWKERNRQLLGL